MVYTRSYASPVGPLVLASDGDNLVALWFERQKYYGEGDFGELTERDDIPALTAACTWLDAYFAGDRPAITALPLATRGSEFREAVWDILRDIPYGEVVTYGSIAKQMAKRLGKATMSSQAVGGAVGHNPIGIIIPCHRVIGTGGSLTGYAAGIDTKIALLTHEGVDVSHYTVPV